MESVEVVIVGAGLAGLTAARALLVDHGVAPTDIAVVEASDTVGGRLATSTIGAATFDHGAQFFTVRSEAFQGDVDRWLAAGVVEEWCRGFAEIDGYPRYRVAGGMNRLAAHLAAVLVADGIVIETDVSVDSIAQGDEHWSVAATRRSGERLTINPRSIILTPPVPLSLALLRAGSIPLEPTAEAALDGFEYHRVLALLGTVDRSLELSPSGALQRPADPTFSFVADNQAKGISEAPAVTFHAAHQRSAELWALNDEEALAALLPAANELVAPAEITSVEVIRWPYTGPVKAHRDAFLTIASNANPGGADRCGPIVLAGDGFGGSKVEGAYTSGRAAAGAVLRV